MVTLISHPSSLVQSFREIIIVTHLTGHRKHRRSLLDKEQVGLEQTVSKCLVSAWGTGQGHGVAGGGSEAAL